LISNAIPFLIEGKYSNAEKTKLPIPQVGSISETGFTPFSLIKLQTRYASSAGV